MSMLGPGGFYETSRAWRRLKLTLAEVLVLSTLKGRCDEDYPQQVLDAANAVRNFKNKHYPQQSLRRRDQPCDRSMGGRRHAG